jgi:RNA polymerase sigma factor (sigma-70 family)
LAIYRGVEQRTAAPGTDRVIEELYSSVAPRLRRVAYLMVGRAEVAEEVVHEAFVRAYDRLGSVDAPAAYLRTTVVNLCLSWRGRRALEQRHQPPGRMVVELPDVDETWELLSGLPRRQRAAVVLRYYEDLPFDRIASIIGCRPATVRSLVHKAIVTLRKEMTP